MFGTGVLVWSRILPRIDLRRALRVSLLAMLAVSLSLLLLNHMASQSIRFVGSSLAVIAVLIMIESGFTPAALSLLAGAVGQGSRARRSDGHLFVPSERRRVDRQRSGWRDRTMAWPLMASYTPRLVWRSWR